MSTLNPSDNFIVNRSGTNYKADYASIMKFTQSGSGAQPRQIADKLQELPSVLDFIPETVGSLALHTAIVNRDRTTIESAISALGNDFTTYFQQAIAAHGRVYVPSGMYIISDTLELTQSYGGLIGDPEMPAIYVNTATSIPAIKVTASGANFNEFSTVENLCLWHGKNPESTPGSANNPRPQYPISPVDEETSLSLSQVSGLVIDGSDSTSFPVLAGYTSAVQRTSVKNVRVLGWGVGVFLGQQVNTRLERIFVENHTDWTAFSNTPSPLSALNLYLNYFFHGYPKVANAIQSLYTLVGGSSYVDGVYSEVPLTGGTGTGALATITVTSGTVSSVQLTFPGKNYTAEDVLSANNSYLGGSGSGFSIKVQNAANGISPQASIEVFNCIGNVRSAPSIVRAFGFYGRGPDLRDIFLTNCETAGGEIGMIFEGVPPFSPVDYNWDIHINRPILDAFTKEGIVIKNIFGPGAVTINGGYAVRSYVAPGPSGPYTGSAAIRLESTSGVFVGGGFQALGFVTRDEDDIGIRLWNSIGNNISGVTLLDFRYGISLEGSSLNTVANNQIAACNTLIYPHYSNPALDPANPEPQYEYGIRLRGIVDPPSPDQGSNGNIISNNIVRGDGSLGVGGKYQTGIFIDTNCEGNTVIANAVEVATVEVPYDLTAENRDNDLGMFTNIRFVAPDQSAPEDDSKIIEADGALNLYSLAGPTVNRGNAAFPDTFPTGGIPATASPAATQVFLDGSGILRAYIDNAGAYVQYSDEGLKTDISPLGPVLDKVKEIEGKKYKFLNSDEINIGFLAQDLQPHFPEVVAGSDGEALSLSYTALIPILWNALNELRQRVEELENPS